MNSRDMNLISRIISLIGEAYEPDAHDARRELNALLEAHTKNLNAADVLCIGGTAVQIVLSDVESGKPRSGAYEILGHVLYRLSRNQWGLKLLHAAASRDRNGDPRGADFKALMAEASREGYRAAEMGLYFAEIVKLLPALGVARFKQVLPEMEKAKAFTDEKVLELLSEAERVTVLLAFWIALLDRLQSLTTCSDWDPYYDLLDSVILTSRELPDNWTRYWNQFSPWSYPFVATSTVVKILVAEENQGRQIALASGALEGLVRGWSEVISGLVSRPSPDDAATSACLSSMLEFMNRKSVARGLLDSDRRESPIAEGIEDDTSERVKACILDLRNSDRRAVVSALARVQLSCDKAVAALVSFMIHIGSAGALSPGLPDLMPFGVTDDEYMKSIETRAECFRRHQ